jgi:hypothetical protein
LITEDTNPWVMIHIEILPTYNQVNI